MNRILWVAQSLLALIFFFAAGLKLFAFDKMAARAPGTANLHSLFIFIACCEIAGGAGLILPGLTRTKPGLTPLAAIGLAAIALLAGLFHLFRREYGEIPGAAVLFLVACFIIFGRWSSLTASVV